MEVLFVIKNKSLLCIFEVCCLLVGPKESLDKPFFWHYRAKLHHFKINF